MSFKLGDIVIDRIQHGVAENSKGELLYVLTQLADGTIDTTAESKDAVDAQGTLVKRFWRGKTGTFTANNAMVNLSLVASTSGSDAETPNQVPKIIDVAASAKTVDVTGLVEGTLKVYGFGTNGSLGTEYKVAEVASDTEYAVADGVLTLPTNSNEVKYVLKYERTVTKDAFVVRNKADKFPATVKLTLKVLAVDPCEVDTLRAAYIVMPSFQPSPETSISLTTDTQLEYKGDLQVDYCSADKVLYEFYWAEDDIED